jgi:hypothetical protein
MYSLDFQHNGCCEGYLWSSVLPKQRVLNRGVPSDNFLDELVIWGRTAPDEIFVANSAVDIYSNVFRVLGPWRGLRHRRAVMLEVMRVLAGFECLPQFSTGGDVLLRVAGGERDFAGGCLCQLSSVRAVLNNCQQMRYLETGRICSMDTLA